MEKEWLRCFVWNGREDTWSSHRSLDRIQHQGMRGRGEGEGHWAVSGDGDMEAFVVYR